MHPIHRARTEELLHDIRAHDQPSVALGPPVVGQLTVDRYLSATRFAHERRTIFGATPVAVAHASELSGPGACLPVDVGGVALLLTRDSAGKLHAHRNACRHRGTRLVSEPCRKKAIVCPYHAWTYELGGKLIHVPHERVFGGRIAERDALQPAFVGERHGMVWASLSPFDLEQHLGEVDAELEALGLGGVVPFQSRAREVRANWKIIIDAFLEGYHIRHLHRETVYPFFLDARARADAVGPHIRAITARRVLGDLAKRGGGVSDDAELRELVTPSYFLFPNVILIFHPTYVSVLTLSPLSVDRTRFSHTMLVPPDLDSAEDQARYRRSFELIDEGLFDREDLFAIEAVQAGLAASADETTLLGDLEQPVLWFHASVDGRLVRPANE